MKLTEQSCNERSKPYENCESVIDRVLNNCEKHSQHYKEGEIYEESTDTIDICDIETSEESFNFSFESEEVELESIQRTIKRFKAFRKLPINNMFEFYVIKKTNNENIRELYSAIGEYRDYCILQKNHKVREYLRLAFIKSEGERYIEIKNIILDRINRGGFKLDNQSNHMTDWYIHNNIHPRLSILTLNINHIENKLDEVNLTINRLVPEIIMFQETYHKSEQIKIFN